MNWKEKLKTVAEALGLTAKVEQKSLTNEEFQQILDAYQRDYQSTLRDDINAEHDAERQQLDEQQRQEMLSEIYAAVVAASGDEPAGQQPDGQQPAVQTVDMQGVIHAINHLGERIQQLSEQPAADRPEHQGAAVVSLHGFGNTPDYLFGAQHPMYSMKLRWNQIAANPSIAATLGEPSQDVEHQFFTQAREYGMSLQKRFAYLVSQGMTDLEALAAGEFSTNYEGVDSLGDMGTQFTVRRQDAIIARVLSTRKMTDYFPVRYGIQDNDVIFNAYFGEVSQAWQRGELYKGDMKIENERGYVDDLMIKMQWGPMKELERKYIGYLNTSGSDPIKWNMIEYQLLNSLQTAQREQNIRRMRGIYVKPEQGVVGSYLTASTGILYRLLDYIHANRLLLNDDEMLRTYTRSTMLGVVKAFVDDVVSNLAEDEDLSGKVLYLNERHRPWWISCIRVTFHLDNDFHGIDTYLNTVPDTGVRIIWLPYLGNLPFMMIHEPGNLQFLEFVPGEMMAVKMEQQMEMVRAWSTWKEGTAAAYLGRRFATREQLVANKFQWQQIFLNKFAADVVADATELDAEKGFWQLTGANTKATVLTDITGAKAGVAYCIECGSTDNATTVAKEGKFQNITKAWAPTAVGDYLMVILRSDGNFAELERMEGGKRTINRELQPHYVG